MRKMAGIVALIGSAVGCANSATPVDAKAEDPKAVEAKAHGAYVAAINSNDLETLVADLTDDVVYQSPHEPEVQGKDAVRKWAAGYFAAYRTTWEKTPLSFKVSGDWAFERYAYSVKDVDKKTGVATTDKGKGINVFKRGEDGKWRVAIDGWSSDIAIPTHP